MTRNDVSGVCPLIKSNELRSCIKSMLSGGLIL